MKISFIIFLSLIAFTTFAKESICYGSTKNGRLENGVKLPSTGINFASYGSLPEYMGRTYVHSKVRDVLIDSYKFLEISQPNKVYKYAETGLRKGGEFKPHKTHRNGLSVDFIVPVHDKEFKSVHLPTNLLNKFGYNIEFDDKGRHKNYEIDFEALGAHIVALDKSSKKHGIKIWRVIFDPQLQPLLYNTTYGDYIKKNIFIPKKKSWVRHDEHYHVDFEIDCLPLE